MKKVSILLNTIDRYDITVKCIGNALATAGYPFELLCCDNGSKDRRVVEYVASLNPVYCRLNETNEGCGQMHNDMLVRATGDYFCLLDNDIFINRQDWLADLVRHYDLISDSGVAGIYTIGIGLDLRDQNVSDIFGLKVHRALPPYEDAIFGTRLFGRRLLGSIGYFCEDYGPYGLVDNDYVWRSYHAGFNNYYIGGKCGEHLGADVGEQSEYRRMKDASLAAGYIKLVENKARYMATGNYFYGLNQGAA